MVTTQPPRRRSIRAHVLLTGLAIAAMLPMVLAGPAGAQAPPVGFDADTPVTLPPGGSSVVVLLNNSTTRFELTPTATLDPPPDQPDGKPLAVPVEPGTGDPADADAGAHLPSAGRVPLRLTAPADAPAGASGWLTVVAKSTDQTVVVRRALQVATPLPTVDAWKVVSYQAVPWRTAGGDIGRPLPLSPRSDCAGLGQPGAELPSGDRSVSITSRCVDGNLQLVAGDVAPGTYGGKLKVGSASVDLEVRRTLSIWWPVGLVLLGVLLALWSQGRLDQGWRGQQRYWLRRLPQRAAKADVQYVVASRELPWEEYALEPVVDDEARALRRRLRDMATQVPLLLRYLPWPQGFMAEERAQVRARIAALDKLVREWPSMPATFEAAHARLRQQPFYVTRAPKLTERALLIVGAGGLPVDATELLARCAEAAALPQALDVVDDLDKLDAYLVALEGVRSRPYLDRETLARARQWERQASATLRELGDATRVPEEVGRLVERGSRLAARLPVPDRAPPPDEDEGLSETFKPGEVLSLPLELARRVGELVRGRGFYLGHTGLILLTLAVGVLSGLAVLYQDKAWGGSWTDYVAAVLWGYAASTVIDPIIGVVRELGTRPGDAAAGEAGA